MGKLKSLLSGLSQKELKILFISLFCVYFIYFISPSGILSSNDGGHLGLASALRYDHSSCVENYKDKYVYWPDYAIKDGKMYSDRLPGTAFVLVVFLYYADFWKVTGLPLLDSGKDLNPIICVLMSNIAGVLTVFSLFLLSFRFFKFSFKLSLISALIFGLCTLNYQESTRFFSHELSCFLVSVSVIILILSSSMEKYKSAYYFAFILLSYSVLVELQNVLFFIPIFIYSVFQLYVEKTKSPKEILKFYLPIFLVSVAIIFILPLYNYLTFGEWILKSNAYNPNFEEEKSFFTALSGDFFSGIEILFIHSKYLGAWFGDGFIGLNEMPGVFIVCPIFIVSFAGWYLFYKKYKQISILFFALIVIEILIAALHKTTLVRHIHTIHLFMFFPVVFVLQEINSMQKNRRNFFIGIVVFLSLVSLFSVCKASISFSYRTKIPVFLFFNLPIFVIIFLYKYKDIKSLFIKNKADLNEIDDK